MEYIWIKRLVRQWLNLVDVEVKDMLVQTKMSDRLFEQYP